MKGRSPILNEEEVSLLVETMNSENVNRSITLDDVRDKLIEGQLKKDERLTHYTIKPVHRTTVSNYFTLLSSHDNLQHVRQVQQKTDNRFTAENSIFSTICYLMTIATTHFRFSNKTDSEKRDMKNTTEGAQLLASLVRKQNKDMDIAPILPGLIFNTDDQTCFVFKGTATNKKKLYLEASNECKSIHSTYVHDKGGTNHLNGVQVRITHSFLSMGYMAPVYLSVTGLNERELPTQGCKDGILVVPVPGLVTSSNSTGSNDVGYIVFLCRERLDNKKTLLLFSMSF